MNEKQKKRRQNSNAQQDMGKTGSYSDAGRLFFSCFLRLVVLLLVVMSLLFLFSFLLLFAFSFILFPMLFCVVSCPGNEQMFLLGLCEIGMAVASASVSPCAAYQPFLLAISWAAEPTHVFCDQLKFNDILFLSSFFWCLHQNEIQRKNKKKMFRTTNQHNLADILCLYSESNSFM